ncbi:DUF4232 domain-containing protein [Streptomyces sp. NPDC057307]|uniref:DUF4232 domain-containing protein n=1 Tax=Streptomyces sp. NPDC057307 TaxID=3346096 RepID=UPI003633021B
MRVRKLTFAALAIATALSLTACNDEDLTGQADPSSTSTGSSAPDDAGSDGSGGSDEEGGKGTVAGTGSNENGKIGKCRTDELDITASDATVGGDAEGTVAVEFKNGAGRDCALAAYAGVDLGTDSGMISAERTGEPVDTTILKDGDSIFFGVTYPMNDSGGSGVRVTSLVVTPPDETKSVSIEWPGEATLPVTDGGGSSVKVGPMGSAGQGEG